MKIKWFLPAEQVFKIILSTVIFFTNFNFPSAFKYEHIVVERKINLEHCLNEPYSFFRTKFSDISFPGASSLLRQNNPVVLIHSGCKLSIYLAYVV